MFLCLDCQRVFEEPKEYVEKHGLDSPRMKYGGAARIVEADM